MGSSNGIKLPPLCLNYPQYSQIWKDLAWGRPNPTRSHSWTNIFIKGTLKRSIKSKAKMKTWLPRNIATGVYLLDLLPASWTSNFHLFFLPLQEYTNHTKVAQTLTRSTRVSRVRVWGLEAEDEAEGMRIWCLNRAPSPKIRVSQPRPDSPGQSPRLTESAT